MPPKLKFETEMWHPNGRANRTFTSCFRRDSRALPSPFPHSQVPRSAWVRRPLAMPTNRNADHSQCQLKLTTGLPRRSVQGWSGLHFDPSRSRG